MFSGRSHPAALKSTKRSSSLVAHESRVLAPTPRGEKPTMSYSSSRRSCCAPWGLAGWLSANAVHSRSVIGSPSPPGPPGLKNSAPRRASGRPAARRMTAREISPRWGSFQSIGARTWAHCSRPAGSSLFMGLPRMVESHSAQCTVCVRYSFSGSGELPPQPPRAAIRPVATSQRAGWETMVDNTGRFLF